MTLINTTLLNSENSKTFDLHGLLFNFTKQNKLKKK